MLPLPTLQMPIAANQCHLRFEAEPSRCIITATWMKFELNPVKVLAVALFLAAGEMPKVQMFAEEASTAWCGCGKPAGEPEWSCLPLPDTAQPGRRTCWKASARLWRSSRAKHHSTHAASDSPRRN